VGKSGPLRGDCIGYMRCCMLKNCGIPEGEVNERGKARGFTGSNMCSGIGQIISDLGSEGWRGSQGPPAAHVGNFVVSVRGSDFAKLFVEGTECYKEG
jgi:hypothetical protein